MPAQTVIKIRRDTQANWDSVNPVLAAGEIAFETDTSKIKVGDGTSTWSQLDYASGAGTAAEITTDTTNFDGLLSGSDTTVQAALETIDDLDISAGVITSDSPPSSPSNGDLWWESSTGNLYIYFDSYWVQVQLGEAGPQGESGVLAVDSPITYDSGTSTVGLDGYVFRETVYFTTSGTFSKASYPWLKAIRVRMVGGGGGSAGTRARGIGQGVVLGRPGGGAASAESFILVDSLTSSVTVTVGAGGSAGPSSGTRTGGNGGQSSFGLGETFEVSANGGFGGAESISVGPFPVARVGTSGASTAVGDVTFPGSNSALSFYFSETSVPGSQPGLSVFFPSAGPVRSGEASQSGLPGNNYGNGASGAVTIEGGSEQSGAEGGQGIVILELFA